MTPELIQGLVSAWAMLLATLLLQLAVLWDPGLVLMHSWLMHPDDTPSSGSLFAAWLGPGR